MREKLKRIVKCTVCTGMFLFLLIGSMRLVSNRLELKSSHIKYDDFLEGENGEDVLFFGSSHMINAVFPDQLYEEYGITSYNLANHGELLPTSYEVFRNALDYSSPKVVVVDLFTIALNDTYYNKAFSHVSLDAFPLTWTKFNSVNVLFDDADTKCEFITNFALYHTRWDEWLESSPEYTPSVMKGAEMRINVETSVGELSATDAYDETMTDGIEALMSFKELCDKRGIQLLCVNIPYSGFNDRDAAINYAETLLEEAGVSCLDFRQESNRLRLNSITDFYDTQHLNPLGGRKVTEYIGEYLISNCGVEDKRGSIYADKWNRAVALSLDERIRRLKAEADNGNMLNTLMMLKANKARGIIIITPWAASQNGDTAKLLLEQMGFDISGIDNLGTNCAWVGTYDEERNIASSQLVNSENDFNITGYISGDDTFYLKYMEDNHFGCSYDGENEVYLHNQMLMLYVFDDAGNLVVERGFGY